MTTVCEHLRRGYIIYNQEDAIHVSMFHDWRLLGRQLTRMASPQGGKYLACHPRLVCTEGTKVSRIHPHPRCQHWHGELTVRAHQESTSYIKHVNLKTNMSTSNTSFPPLGLLYMCQQFPPVKSSKQKNRNFTAKTISCFTVPAYGVGYLGNGYSS